MMGIEDEHGVVFVKDLLRAVAMMVVPIHNQYTLHPMRLLDISRCDRHVVVNAEAHAARWGGVVAGGRTAQKAFFTFSVITASTAFNTPPAANCAASKDPGEITVSPVLRSVGPRKLESSFRTRLT